MSLSRQLGAAIAKAASEVKWAFLRFIWGDR